MKTVTYPIRLSDQLYKRVRLEARKRQKKLSEAFREVIAYGLDALPPMPELSELTEDTWEKLGPSPTVNYDKL